MIYKIIFSIAIFILSFMIIKDEIQNYSKEAKIMLLFLSILWFPVFLMELRTMIYIIMTTMLICIAFSENNFFSYNVSALKILFFISAHLLMFLSFVFNFLAIIKNKEISLTFGETCVYVSVWFPILFLNIEIAEKIFDIKKFEKKK